MMRYGYPILPTNFCTEIGLWVCKFCTPLYCGFYIA